MIEEPACSPSVPLCSSQIGLGSKIGGSGTGSLKEWKKDTVRILTLKEPEERGLESVLEEHGAGTTLSPQNRIVGQPV